MKIIKNSTFWTIIVAIVFAVGILATIASGVLNPLLIDWPDNDTSKMLFLSYYLTYRSCEIITGQVSEIMIKDYDDKYKFVINNCNYGGLIFPSMIKEGSIKGFFFAEKHYTDEGDISRSELYIEWSFVNNKSYEEEVQRISSIANNDKQVLLSYDLFSLPSYIAEYQWLSGFEYALIDEENLIIRYIYLKEVGTYYQIVFDNEYAPHKWISDSDLPKEQIANGRYSIYWS